jgi:phosphoribosylformylglycinamidine synthase I
MRWGVVRFPGSLDDGDAVHALTQTFGDEVRVLWHKDRDLHDVDCVILPGGFSYGDYLRPGAMARFAPVMESVVRFAGGGGLVLGLCNGFQILCEAGLLPGALIRNRSLTFVCRWLALRIEETDTPFTRSCGRGDLLTLPIKHGGGCFVADERTLRELEDERRVILRYVDPSGRETEDANPNGSLQSIAGIVSPGRNVFGMMPHPEHACEKLLGGEDGARIFRSIRATMSGGMPAPSASVPPGL